MKQLLVVLLMVASVIHAVPLDEEAVNVESAYAGMNPAEYAAMMYRSAMIEEEQRQAAEAKKLPNINLANLTNLTSLLSIVQADLNSLKAVIQNLVQAEVNKTLTSLSILSNGIKVKADEPQQPQPLVFVLANPQQQFNPFLYGSSQQQKLPSYYFSNPYYSYPFYPRGGRTPILFASSPDGQYKPVVHE